MRTAVHLVTVISMIIFSGCAEFEIPKTPPLHEAVMSGDVKKIQTLLDNGANVDEEYYGTPLIWAAGGGHLPSVKLFVQRGANINARTEMGWTPLGNAMSERREAVAKYLLDNGADIDNALGGLHDWMAFCKKNDVSICINKLTPAIAELQSMKQKGVVRLADTKHEETKKDDMQQKVDKLAANNDLKGLKEYTEKNPNAVYYIKDEWLRLALTGPKGMKVGDIREYLKSGKSEKIIVAMIKQQETPYKKFSMSEIDMLLKMELSENVITAMIDVTTKLMDNAKIAKQQQFFLDEQKKIADQQMAAVYQSNTAQTADTESSSVKDQVQSEVIKQGVGVLLDQLFK